MIIRKFGNQSLAVVDVHLEYLQNFGDDSISLIAVFADKGTRLLNKYEIKQTNLVFKTGFEKCRSTIKVQRRMSTWIQFSMHGL